MRITTVSLLIISLVAICCLHSLQAEENRVESYTGDILRELSGRDWQFEG